MKNNTSVLKKVLNVFKWILFVIGVGFAVLIIVRMFHFSNVEKTNEAVAKIHATKLTLDDVMGKNLPPDPGVEADKTVQGIDANKNGIRDDVELAVFKEYPNSAKTRAPLLQYALMLQLETNQTVLNEEIVTEIITENSRAHECIADGLVPRKTPESTRTSLEVDKIDTYVQFIDNRQLNTEARKMANKDFYEMLRSYSESTNISCDIDPLVLIN